MDRTSDRERCWVHQGHNLRSFREAKGMPLDVMAREAGISLEEAFRLEMSQVIKGEVLDKLSKVLNVSLECLRDTEEVIPVYETVTNFVNNFSGNGVVNGVQEPGGSHWEDMNFYANPVVHPVDKITELYERLMESKQSQLESDREKLENCRRELEQTRNELEKSNQELEKSRLRIKELEQKLSDRAAE